TNDPGVRLSLSRWYLARGDPPHFVGEPFQPLLRVVELRRRHLLRPAGDLACVAEQVVQDLPQRPVLATLGAGPRAHAVWIPSARTADTPSRPPPSARKSPRLAGDLPRTARPPSGATQSGNNCGARPMPYVWGFAPHLLPRWIAHEVAHAVRYTSPTSRARAA